ncbi:MAG: 30S ribosome-binding factor RbfA [Bacteroidales bacterium]|nr:30S ribosome-binding factor RbfA [Bacteroidales bacterium]
MDTIRQQKTARLIQKELAEIFLHEGKNFFGNSMITVTVVRISPDLSIARVYLSLFAVKDKESLLKTIKIYTSEIRKLLGMRIGKQVRIIPELNFYLDDSLDYAEKIDKALKNK